MSRLLSQIGQRRGCVDFPPNRDTPYDVANL
jgi:hypothetical protein